MNNNELENIETIDLGGNVEPTTEPVDTNVEVPAQSVEPVINATEVPVQNIPVTPEVPVTIEPAEPVVNPQTATLNQIQPDVINAVSENEASIPTNNENMQQISDENDSKEKVEVVPVESKSSKESWLPLVLLFVGLLVFILLIPTISKFFNGI